MTSTKIIESRPTVENSPPGSYVLVPAKSPDRGLVRCRVVAWHMTPAGAWFIELDTDEILNPSMMLAVRSSGNAAQEGA